MSVRVLIVEDQAPFRAAAAAVIDLTEPFVLAGAVASGEESLARLQDLVPDLVLMDINLPGMDGIEAAALIAARPQPPIVVLMSTHSRLEYADRIEECAPWVQAIRQRWLWSRPPRRTRAACRAATRAERLPIVPPETKQPPALSGQPSRSTSQARAAFSAKMAPAPASQSPAKMLALLAAGSKAIAARVGAAGM
jgi:CheY-like chemotaxis protein